MHMIHRSEICKVSFCYLLQILLSIALLRSYLCDYVTSTADIARMCGCDNCVTACNCIYEEYNGFAFCWYEACHMMECRYIASIASNTGSNSSSVATTVANTASYCAHSVS